MAHTVSLTYSRFERISPIAVALAMLLHGLLGVTVWQVSLIPPIAPAIEAIEVTVEPPPPALVPEPSPEQVAQPPEKPPPEPEAPRKEPPKTMAGLDKPIGTTLDPRALLRTAPEAPPEATAIKPPPQAETKPQAAPEPAAKPTQEAALATPPAPEPPARQPNLAAPPEKTRSMMAVPPSAPAPVKPAPPAPPVPPTPPAPPQRQAAPRPAAPPSPLSHVPQQRTSPSQEAARAAPSPFVNPADAYGERKLQESYLWGVARKVSQYAPGGGGSRDSGTVVVVLVTIARNGQLLDARISRSSGDPGVDAVVMQRVRAGAPYAPLPADVAGDRHTFSLPLQVVTSGD